MKSQKPKKPTTLRKESISALLVNDSSVSPVTRSALPLSMKDLQEDWRIWINEYQTVDSLRFGQYVLNKRLAKGYIWPDCFYADTERAWNYLFNWINFPIEGLTSKPKLQFLN